MRRCLIFTTLALLLATTLAARPRATAPKGSVPLDVLTFDRVIERYDGHVLVKFDKLHPFGEKEEEYKRFVERVSGRGSKAYGLLLAQVNVGEFGDKENDELRTRYQLEVKDFPVYKLFHRQTKTPVATFEGEIKMDALAAFVTLHAGVWMGLPGCVEALDQYARRFLAADANEQRTLLAESEKVTLKDADDQEAGQQYLVIMRKAIENPDYIDTEYKRVEKLLKGKIAEKQKQKLIVRKNILVSFGTKPAGGDTKKDGL